MEEDGLAMQGAAPMGAPQGAPANPAGGVDPQLLEQVIQMLADGMSPDELLARGVPEEVIIEAIEMLTGGGGGEMPAGGAPEPQPAPATDSGLAASGMM